VTDLGPSRALARSRAPRPVERPQDVLRVPMP
jgi:hypothetical protein